MKFSLEKFVLLAIGSGIVFVWYKHNKEKAEEKAAAANDALERSQ